MMTFSPIRLSEIRETALSAGGRAVGSIAHAHGPLRAPLDGLVVLVPTDPAQDPGAFGLALEAQGYARTQHLGLDAFRAAKLPVDGLPANGVYLAQAPA